LDIVETVKVVGMLYTLCVVFGWLGVGVEAPCRVLTVTVLVGVAALCCVVRVVVVGVIVDICVVVRLLSTGPVGCVIHCPLDVLTFCVDSGLLETFLFCAVSGLSKILLDSTI